MKRSLVILSLVFAMSLALALPANAVPTTTWNFSGSGGDVGTTEVFTASAAPRLATTFSGGVTDRTLVCAKQHGRDKAASKASR